MSGIASRRMVATLLCALLLAMVAPSGLAHADTEEHSGTLANGATWRAVVPDDWNGTLLLYSHGYLPSFAPVPNDARIAPDEDTRAALLDHGYALAGSSYADKGWALPTAVDDQLATLDAARQAIGTPIERVLAYGSSMGGLVTARLAETAGDAIDGAMPTCGLMVGGVDLNNFQIDAAHAIDELLAPGTDIAYADFAHLGEAFAATGELTAAVVAGQQTPQGRARVALASALHHLPDWRQGSEEPARRDHAARQQAMYEWLVDTLPFVTPARYDLEVAAGGNASWNVGVDYREVFRQSADRRMVEAMYREAGLDLRDDLDRLTATADVAPDEDALDSMYGHSAVTGDLQVPVLAIHTTDDNLAPLQFEEEYVEDVRSAGDRGLLRQAVVARSGHCAFTPAELVAGVQVLEQRVASGHWRGTTTSPRRLNAVAASLGLGEAAFVRVGTGEFLADRTWPQRSQAVTRSVSNSMRASAVTAAP